MTREGISLFEEAKSAQVARDEFLNSYILLAIGTISGIDAKTGLARVRVYVNNPVRVYDEYEGVEVLLPGGITLPLGGCTCIVFAPRTPMFLNGDELRLYNAGRPYDKQALKAIPIWLPSAVSEIGAGYSGTQKFSMYTPFGEISAAEDGLGIHYNGEEAKSGFFIDEGGILHVFNGFTWIQLNNDDTMVIHSEDDDTTTEVITTPKGVTLKVKKTPESEDEDEVDYHLTTIGEDGTLKVSVIGEEKTSTVELTPSADNKFTVATSGDSPTELLAVETDEEGTLVVKQNGHDRAVLKDADGITFTDNSNNKIEMTTSGTSVTDKNNNKIEMTTSGITLTDKNSNKVEMTSSGITLTDMSSHKIEMTSTKITLQGTLGSMEIT